MPGFATRYVEVALDSTLADRTIEDGNPILVEGITISSNTSVSVDINDSDGNDIMNIRSLANTTTSIEIPFIAHNGILLPAGASTTIVSVFYRTDG